MIASIAIAPITIPAIAPVEGPGFKFCICVGEVILVIVPDADVSEEDEVGLDIVDGNATVGDCEEMLVEDFPDPDDMNSADDVPVVVDTVLPEIMPDTELDISRVVVVVGIALGWELVCVVVSVATGVLSRSSRIQNWPVIKPPEACCWNVPVALTALNVKGNELLPASSTVQGKKVSVVPTARSQSVSGPGHSIKQYYL